MGMLIDGAWKTTESLADTEDGEFKRAETSFRNWITSDGSPGPTGDGGFAAESGRYHLYVSYACPWAHRTLMFRKLKELEPHIDLSVVDPHMGDRGWQFGTGDGCIPDPLHDADYLHEVYTAADSGYTGRVTVPVLWDKRRATIVSNESSEIIRMFNTAFDAITGNTADYYPESHRSEIDELNDRIYETVNNGVYRAGFATSQSAYENAVEELFETLDVLDHRLSDRRYLTGAGLTEADIRLFATLIRFDPVYVGHFKCNVRCIADYANLDGYMRDIYQHPGIAETVRLDHIKRHYYTSHPDVNPTGIIPVGPRLDLDRPHGRETLG